MLRFQVLTPRWCKTFPRPAEEAERKEKKTHEPTPSQHKKGMKMSLNLTLLVANKSYIMFDIT